MDRRRCLLLAGPGLLMALAFGGAAASQPVAASAPERATAASVPLDKPIAELRGKPKEYREAYVKGYTYAGKNCNKAESFSYGSSASWDRKGWVDGYNAGHADLCKKAG
ncbi:hypothetical protein [Streptosporangium sp. NPDC051022]|uniref:hypothetical protein n=1 Tax=Streptosporangium sp. NPDC051022 TaxID=3155752 RepID=UPI003431059F